MDVAERSTPTQLGPGRGPGQELQVLEEHGAGPGGHTHRVPPAQRWESQRRALWGVGGG